MGETRGTEEVPQRNDPYSTADATETIGMTDPGPAPLAGTGGDDSL